MKNHSHHVKQDGSLSKQIVKGTIVSATLGVGGKVMSKLVKYPVVVFGMGVVAGYFVYKYRKEIISKTSQAVDAGKDFVLQQKENLEDIVAEAKEDLD
ncbi:MAG: hypothetical protein ABL903_02995 [Methylococcales bacterium]